MTNYKIIIQYDGGRYNGWQRLRGNDNTIQGKIETVLSRILDQPIEINGSGRTDAGVHALAQVANFIMDEKHLDKYYPNLAEHIKTEANNYLPLDIRVLSCEKAKDKFHARLNAHSKVYEYRIDNGEVADIFNRKYLTRIDTPIDIEKLKAASKHFLGNHDFQAFCANKHMKKSTVRTINSIDIRKENGIIYIRYDGDGFLRNMVRIITGTIVDVALGKIPESDIDKIFESKVRANAAPTAPPEGLFLVEVRYN